MPSPRPTPHGSRRGPPRRPPAHRPGARPATGVDRRREDGLERLQKVLATAGIGSRRACEELITAGRVEVDRAVVTQLGTRVDPAAQEIRVDGERLPRVRRVVYLLNKPVGVVTTNYDPAGRPRAVDLVPVDQRLFAVGRLDRTSEGLLLLTNDGELANLLAHPRYGVEKKYLVQVAGVPSAEVLDQLRQGVRLAEGEVHAKRITVRTHNKQSTVLEMVLDEGKNREIRRMLARLGHKVHQLKRVAIGGLSLGNLLPGQSRPLAWTEVETLRKEALAATAGERGPVRPMRQGRGDGGRPRGRRPGERPRAGGRGGGGPRFRDTARAGGTSRGEEARATTRRRTKPRRPGKASSWRNQQKPGTKAGGAEP